VTVYLIGWSVSGMGTPPGAFTGSGISRTFNDFPREKSAGRFIGTGRRSIYDRFPNEPIATSQKLTTLTPAIASGLKTGGLIPESSGRCALLP
jgi:hypothetical protein